MRWISILVIAAGLLGGCAAETAQMQPCPEIGCAPPTEQAPSSIYDCANCDDDECTDECAAMWSWWYWQTMSMSQSIAN